MFVMRYYRLLENVQQCQLTGTMGKDQRRWTWSVLKLKEESKTVKARIFSELRDGCLIRSSQWQ